MLLDTSGLLALLDGRERQHQSARDIYQAATRRVTHGFVLAELVALANARRMSSSPVLTFVSKLIANPAILTIWPNERLTAQALALLMGRQGRGYSLCDALSFVIMRSESLSDALTTDKHFEEEGFRRMLE